MNDSDDTGAASASGTERAYGAIPLSDLEVMNDGRPVTWSDACAPGGYVCAMPDDLTADGICGNPVESEPCGRHGDAAEPGAELDARLAARLAALSAPPSDAKADAAATERERIRQLAIRTHAVTVSRTGRMMPFEELLRHSPEENAELLLQVVAPAPAAPCGCLHDFEHGPQCGRLTPGQAAYEAFRRAFPNEDWGPWDSFGVADEGGHEGWEAIAAAAWAPERDRLNAVLAENASLRDQIAEQSRQRNRLAGDHNELDDRHAALLEEILRNADEDIKGADEAHEYLAEAWVRHLEQLLATLTENARLGHMHHDELAESYRKLEAEMTEVRRIAYQGGQDAASVRRELLAYLEARDAC